MVRFTSLSEARRNLTHARQAAHMGAHVVGKRFQVGRHHLQLVVVPAREVVARQHLGHGHHLALQGRGGFGRVVVQRQLHKAQHAPAHALAVQVGVVARNHPGFFQRTHAPPAGRGGKRHRLGQVAHGGTAVALQGVEQGAVYGSSG